MWAGIGGHLEADENGDPTKCVLREVEEDIGIKPHHMWGINDLKFQEKCRQIKRVATPSEFL